MIDPSGGEIITSGDSYDSRGGPRGAILGVVVFASVAVGLVVVVGGLELLVAPLVPGWVVLPAVIVALTAFIIVAFAGMNWLREWLYYR